MNRIAATLMALASIGTLSGALYLIVVSVSGPRFAASEQFGVAVGVVTLSVAVVVAVAARAVWRDERRGWITALIVAIGLGLLAFVVWTTPGPPPLPRLGTALMAAIAAGLIAVSAARAMRSVSRR
jgi:peptidoglycan/LPS O-acetylase OafA/YrhL